MNLGGPPSAAPFAGILPHPMTASNSSGYWYAVRAPRYSLSIALPLLLAYEVLAFTLSGSEVAGALR